MANLITSYQDSNVCVSQLEAIYKRYGAGVYTLCLRLLADEKTAESATADVFVQFNKELASQPDESRTTLRLRELAVEAALRQMRRHGIAVVFIWLRDVLLRLRRLWPVQ